MERRLGFWLISAFIFSILFFSSYAHENGDSGESDDLVDYFASTSILYVVIGSAIVVLVTLISVFYKKKTNTTKWVLFLLIAVPVILVTFYITGAALYLNSVSLTKGPVHWHADFEIWNCGNKVDLVDPKGFSNRVGEPVFHEHGDNRIHVEGVVVNEGQVSLSKFFAFVGGALDHHGVSIPTNDGVLEMRNGDLCNGDSGELQVFVYKILNPEDTKEWRYEQIKVDDFEDYVLSPYSNVPPGDCIIMEFDAEKEYTDKVCKMHDLAIQRGELVGS